MSREGVVVMVVVAAAAATTQPLVLTPGRNGKCTRILWERSGSECVVSQVPRCPCLLIHFLSLSADLFTLRFMQLNLNYVLVLNT